MKTPESKSPRADLPEPAGSPPDARHALVGAQPFFRGMKPEHIDLLADSALQVKFQRGQMIFREGNPANRFYLILKGKVSLESEGKDGASTTIQTLGPGDDLGWSWLFPPYYLHFSAYALEPTEAIFFYGTRLREQCEGNRDLAYELMKRVAAVVVQRLESNRKACAPPAHGAPHRPTV